MNILGWILAVIGLVGLIFGLRNMLKGKKMGSVPFRKPSEIAQQGVAAADAKQMVSTEGQVQMGPQPLKAPMSGEPCLAYEILVERKWEKQERTEQGMKTKTGTDRLHTEYRGSIFQLADAAGAVTVDASQQPDTDLDKTHSSSVSVGMMIPGTLHFGQLQMNTPHVSHDSKTTAFVGTEKILRPSATLYALGQIGQGPQGLTISTPKGLGTGKLILHHQGREALLGKTKRNMILGYVIGGLLFAGGGGLGLFGPKADLSSKGTACSNQLSGALTCDGRMFEREGIDYKWTVTEAGVYSITVKQPNVKAPVDGALTITDSGGAKVAYNDGGSPGQDAFVSMPFQPGTYNLNVADFAHDKVTGGYGFQLIIVKKSAAPSGSGAPALTAAPAATAVATTKPTAAPAGKPAPKKTH
jgi:hypothetical protein